jgi:hypothetical protein
MTKKRKKLGLDLHLGPGKDLAALVGQLHPERSAYVFRIIKPG